MSYYTDIYLPSINRFGTDPQSRTQGARERGFDLFLSRTPNKVSFVIDDKTYYGAVEDKISNEEEVTSYLLVQKDFELESGTIVTVTSLSDSSVRNYLVIIEEKHDSIGYKRYIVTLLDREIDWIVDGMVYDGMAHLITGKDKKLLSNFSIINNAAVDLLKENCVLLMAATDQIKEGTRLLLGKKSWIISGIDDISIPAIYYITLMRDFKDETYDTVIANEQLLEKWSISSITGDIVDLGIYTQSEGIDPQFKCYYNGELRNEELKIEVSDLSIAKYENNKLVPLTVGETICKVSLKNNLKVFKNFTIRVLTTPIIEIGLNGPKKISVLATAEYEVTGQGVATIYEFSSQNGHFIVNYVTDTKISITGKSIGEDAIIMKQNGMRLCTYPISIQSAWMMG